MQTVIELALESPLEVAMVKVARMQLEVIGVDLHRRILELDDDLDALALGARAKVHERMLVARELLEDAPQPRIDTRPGHTAILLAVHRMERSGLTPRRGQGENSLNLHTILSSNGGTTMTTRSFALTAGVIFSLISLLHLLRIIFGWQAVLEGWTVPLWPSWIAMLVGVYLGYQGFRLGKKPQ